LTVFLVNNIISLIGYFKTARKFGTSIKKGLKGRQTDMVNSVVVVGRVGQDPEMRYFDNGKVKTTFSLAVNRWDSRTKEEITDWFNIEVWDKQAEVAGEWVKKGRLVGVEGRIVANKWQTPDGEVAERFIIRCSNVRLMGSKKDEN